MSQRRRWWPPLLGLTALVLAAPLVAHVAIGRLARMTPPTVERAPGELVTLGGELRVFGASYARRRGALLEVRLVGDPTAIGAAHGRLLYPEMVENEGILLRRFNEQVASWPLRMVLLDVAQYRYRGLDAQLSNARRFELASTAVAFQPDPYAQVFPTYQRHVYLNALYDIALSFEHSPLVGCTTFVLSGADVAGGDTLLARAFDFEVDDIFDRGKAVFLVREAGQIPFASVAWPGLVGVMSGMNAEGVAVVVHGGRAGAPRVTGEPVLHGLRRVLATAHDAEEAVAALAAEDVMVSHIVVLADARGRAAAVERVPGMAPHVRWLPRRAVVTNHLEGPAAGDEKNQRVMAATTSVARRQRGDELVAALEPPLAVDDAVALLRDRRGVGGAELPPGDRRAIDALIATHGVVMNTRQRVLWVSEGPHLLGRFVAFDLRRLLAEQYAPEHDERPLVTLPADPWLTGGDYERWRRAH